ncbi:PfkB family carbohydrate kinase [Pseudonocardia acaciae]|uniref:PfkB family carbohydrate kinase n=1 Tax=Pseudonocardia acaciae TaxID=551276 RepID=UPI00048F87D1|nr:PfkB family carbohydrate kinase [Pseudonocardia acaciae]
MNGRLVHTGQVVIDLVMRVGALPPAGGDVAASQTRLLPGGGFNVMSAAARSGARVLYAGAHGTGRFGDLARAALRDEGVAVAHRPEPGADTGVCVVLVDDTGERTFVTGTGAEGRLRPRQLAEVDVRDADLVYLTGYSLLHESNRAALLGWLPGVPARVLFDPGPLLGAIPPGVLDRVLPEVDILSCNATEAYALTGLRDPTAGAVELTGRVGRHASVLVRTGASGCVLAHPGRAARPVPGFPVTPVDTNGAGDTHCGVLASAILAGVELETAAVRANAAAALSVLRLGPATAPLGTEVDEFLLEGTRATARG